MEISTDQEIVQFTMKMPRSVREELRVLAHDRGLTTTSYLQACVGVERWNFDRRDVRVLLDRPTGTVEALLPYAGITSSTIRLR
jgi:hypothetical protein